METMKGWLAQQLHEGTQQDVSSVQINPTSWSGEAVPTRVRAYTSKRIHPG